MCFFFPLNNLWQIFKSSTSLFWSGGWYCFSRQTCDSRYETMRRLMSSTKWPLTRTGDKTLKSFPTHQYHPNTKVFHGLQRLAPKSHWSYQKEKTSPEWKRLIDVCVCINVSKLSSVFSSGPSGNLLFVYTSLSLCRLYIGGQCSSHTPLQLHECNCWPKQGSLMPFLPQGTPKHEPKHIKTSVNFNQDPE